MIDHPLTNELIAEMWPEVDTETGIVDVRAQFNTLMEALSKTPGTQP